MDKTSFWNGPQRPAGSTVACQTFSGERVDSTRPSKVVSVGLTQPDHSYDQGKGSCLGNAIHVQHVGMELGRAPVSEPVAGAHI
jgi:hypothetical protein